MFPSRSGVPLVVVTGSHGQLGTEIRLQSGTFPQIDFLFLSREECAIDDFQAVSERIRAAGAAYCINCAAYTAVDKAELEAEAAFLVNGESVGVLAAACRAAGTRFIQISTDYVFNGEGSRPYREDDPTDPINVYGASKLLGEEKTLEEDPGAIIIRTSWVYSTVGNNFVKTMLRLLQERDQVAVVNDQFGSPTYAADLAGMLLSLIISGKWVPGTYHYSSEGSTSWYEFAMLIKETLGSPCRIVPVSSREYVTAARRPAYSVLDKSKIKGVYGISIPVWKQRVEMCLSRMISHS